jgi:hypothetical protein
LHRFSTDGGQGSKSSRPLTWLWRWAPVVAQMAAIFFASSISDVPDLPGGLSNYTGHMIGYGLLGVLAVRALAGARWAGVTSRAAVAAVVFCAVYGVTDEVHQMFVAQRTSDIHDWFADVGGASIAVVFVLAAARLIRRQGAEARGV